AVLGPSMGGAIAIDFTLTNPKRVAALIPVAAGLGGYQFDAAPALQTEMRAAYDRGDKARAAEISLQMWTDGPNRTPDQVDPLVRERIRAMTLHMFNLPDADQDYRQQLDPPAVLRLKEIHVPTLFVVGDQDVRGILDIADLIVKDVPGARMAIIPGTAHHLNMEKPAEFNQIVLDFLNSLGSS
ncbi:MAG TPA: alpha/beta hydrolase, partial [Anaerolineae bacterium]